MRDLLEAFVACEWVSTADFSTLERENESYITDDLRSRADDIIWRVRCGEETLYLLVEFQSTNDRFMAVRVLTYVGLLYQDLIRRSNSRELDELPAILPIVLHSGRKPWSAADEISALVSEGPRGVEPYRPRLRYLLIDQVRYNDADLASRRNLVAMLFRIESCRQCDVMQRLVRTLGEWLEDPELRDLRRAFSVWLKRVVFKRLSREQEHMGENLREVSAMLSETFEDWDERFDRWEKELREKGRQEELRRLLSRRVEKRFGELPALVGNRLRDASLEELESWTDGLLDAANLGEVIGCVQPRQTDN